MQPGHTKKQNFYVKFQLLPLTVICAAGLFFLFTALKIQVSGATADLLHTLRAYVLTCRGTLNVKVTLYSCLLYLKKSHLGCHYNTVDKGGGVGTCNTLLDIVVAILIGPFLVLESRAEKDTVTSLLGKSNEADNGTD